MNKTISTLKNQTIAVFGLLALSFIVFASVASAATYAYVDNTGAVKPVVADSWQQAIASALNIHMHSGVMLLDSANDFDIVGNDVSGY